MNQTATASLMRSINRSVILDLIRQNSPISRAAIARRLAASLPAVMRIEPILKRLVGVVPYVPRLVASPLERRAAVMGAIMLVLHATTEHFVVRRVQ